MASRDIAKCQMCHCLMSQPKLIKKCSHSFCLQCLKRHCGEKPPGSQISCPLHTCNQEFTIPEGGVEYLPDNTFLYKLIACQNIELCTVHASEDITAFCQTCCEGACLKCLLAKHSGHHFCDIAKAKEDLTDEIKKMATKSEKLNTFIRKSLLKVNASIDEFDKQTAILKSHITNRGNEMKQQIDNQVSQLLLELASHSEENLVEINFCKVELEDRKVEMETLLRESKTALDRTNDRNTLFLLNELKSKHEQVCKSMPRVATVECKMSLKPENLDGVMIVGKLINGKSGKDEISMGPIKLMVYQKFPCELDFQVCMVYDKQLFCASCSSKEIYIYNGDPSKLVNKFKIPDLQCPTSMATTCNCLFLSNSLDTRIDILRIDLFSYKVSFKWSAPGHYGKVSLTDEDNILLCTSNPNVLIEYSLEGKVEGKIKLDKSWNPQHAVKIKNKYLVCNSGSNIVLFLIDCYGDVLNIFQGSKDCPMPELRFPCHLIRDANSNLLVFDSCNSRILIIKDDLRFAREIRFDEAIFCNKTNGSLDVYNNLYLSNTSDSHLYIFDLAKVLKCF